MSLMYTAHHDAIRFGVWHITESENELEYLSGCTASAHASSPARRLEYLAVRSLMVSMDLDPETLAYQPSGKPYLRNTPGTISVSHTKNYAAIAFSEQSNVGIDIEQRSERVVRVRHKFMHPEEEDAVTKSAMDTSTALLVHWCAKEAVFKAVPEENIDFSHEIRVVRIPVLQPLSDGTISFTDCCRGIPREKPEGGNDTNTGLPPSNSGEARFLRTDLSFKLEGWMSADVVLVLCHAPLIDLPVSE